MRIFGVSNLKEGSYSTIQQIALDPEDLDWFVQGYIIWYKDWNEGSLDLDYISISDIFEDGWKIWECHSRIFNCLYKEGIIYDNKKGVLEIEYEEGNLIKIKFWNTKDSYLKYNKPDFIYGKY